MPTVKAAITMPEKLVTEVDAVREAESISRSAYITRLVVEAVKVEKKAQLKTAYDKIFFDEGIAAEQEAITTSFNHIGHNRGQEW